MAILSVAKTVSLELWKTEFAGGKILFFGSARQPATSLPRTYARPFAELLPNSRNKTYEAEMRFAPTNRRIMRLMRQSPSPSSPPFSIGFASKVAAAEDVARKKNDPRNDTNEHESD
jgi:hypothetical protein